MSAIADQLLALAKHTGAPDVVEDAAILIRSLEGVRAERDVLQEIVDEQRGHIAQLIKQVETLHEDAKVGWAAGYEEAELDIIELLKTRAHDPWPDHQWPAANEVLMQIVGEIESGEHVDMFEG